MANTIIAPNYAKHPVLIKRVRAASTAAAAAARLFWGIPNAAAAVCFSQVVPGKYLFRPNPCRRGCFPLKHHSSTLIVSLSLISWHSLEPARGRLLFHIIHRANFNFATHNSSAARAFSQGQLPLTVYIYAKGTVRPKSDRGRFCVWNLPEVSAYVLCALARCVGAQRLFAPFSWLCCCWRERPLNFPEKHTRPWMKSRFCRFPLSPCKGARERLFRLCSPLCALSVSNACVPWWVNYCTTTKRWCCLLLFTERCVCFSLGLMAVGVDWENTRQAQRRSFDGAACFYIDIFFSSLLERCKGAVQNKASRRRHIDSFTITSYINCNPSCYSLTLLQNSANLCTYL